jgi:tetratricopeptide (TPR) repeat protein
LIVVKHCPIVLLFLLVIGDTTLSFAHFFSPKKNQKQILLFFSISNFLAQKKTKMHGRLSARIVNVDVCDETLKSVETAVAIKLDSDIFEEQSSRSSAAGYQFTESQDSNGSFSDILVSPGNQFACINVALVRTDDNSVACSSKIVRLAYLSAQNSLEKCIELRHAESPGAVVARLEISLSFRHKDTLAHGYEVQRYSDAGRHDRVLQCVDAALSCAESVDSMLVILVAKVDALLSLNRFEDAVIDVERLYEAAPNRAMAWYARGRRFEALEEFERAEAAYVRGLELCTGQCPKLRDALARIEGSVVRALRYGERLYAAGDFAGALRQWADASKSGDGQDSAACLHMRMCSACACVALERIEDAERHVVDVVRSAPASFWTRLVTVEGVLQKRGAVNTMFRKRHFRLAPPFLLYFSSARADDFASSLRGVVVLGKFSLVEKSHSLRASAMLIRTATRTFEMRTNSKAELKPWIEALEALRKRHGHHELPPFRTAVNEQSRCSRELVVTIQEKTLRAEKEHGEKEEEEEEEEEEEAEEEEQLQRQDDDGDDHFEFDDIESSLALIGDRVNDQLHVDVVDEPIAVVVTPDAVAVSPPPPAAAGKRKKKIRERASMRFFGKPNVQSPPALSPAPASVVAASTAASSSLASSSFVDSSPPETWTTKQVCRWLEHRVGGVKARTVDRFRANDVMGIDLLRLTDAEMHRDLGIDSLGQRRLIARHLDAQLRRSDASLPTTQSTSRSKFQVPLEGCDRTLHCDDDGFYVATRCQVKRVVRNGIDASRFRQLANYALRLQRVPHCLVVGVHDVRDDDGSDGYLLTLDECAPLMPSLRATSRSALELTRLCAQLANAMAHVYAHELLFPATVYDTRCLWLARDGTLKFDVFALINSRGDGAMPVPLASWPPLTAIVELSSSFGRGADDYRWCSPDVTHFAALRTESSVVWLWAMLAWSMFSLQEAPLAHLSGAAELRQATASGVRPARPEHMPSSLNKLLLWCWRDEPVDRPSFSDVRNQLELIVAVLTTPDINSPPRASSTSASATQRMAKPRPSRH